MKKSVLNTLVALLLSMGNLLAQLTTPAPSTDSTASPASRLTFSGYAEIYYVQDFDQPRAHERPGFLYNHKRNREVNVNLAFIKAAYAGERLRGNLALQVGTYAQYNYAAEQPLLRNIFEANAGVKLAKNRDLWLDAGIFSSHIGFESAISKDCWTLTRSLVAENSPYYLAGAKLTYNSPNGKWTLLGSVLNGWQRINRLPGYTKPSFSTQVQYRPNSAVTFNWSTFMGADRPDSLKQTRFYNNIYAIINPTGKLGLMAGFDIGADRKPLTSQGQRVGSGSYVWYTPVVIARYATSSRSYVAGRVEYYDDKNGVIISTGTGTTDRTNGFQTWGYSVNYDYAILSDRSDVSAVWRIEYRVFSSRDAIFAETAFGPARRTNQALTISLAISF
ncbi:putative OmpL-like beta-barrel porin-2 [Larkinella arboricola]|uniref:Putative OmpL-like beta-barrel porin-2 n=1 Tax=Larkinella arboricola TaxID=643671 RepID=A0A327WSU2_LARAB|nr:porin [Larkinella arboricola]RAJ95533.1 putative OmpL-like beta-barrel porin-2 [Larkinella arboricola]